MPRKICFMVMPFSKKPTGLEPGEGPAEVDFDALWNLALAPILEELGYAPVRADADTGSLIIKAMVERLAYADLVVADISIPNANVYYEIGVRHAVRQRGCVLISADWSRPLFDVQQMRRLTYPLPEGTIVKDTAEGIRDILLPAIRQMESKLSPVHETVPGATNQLDEQSADLDRVKSAIYDPERVKQFKADMDELSNLMADIRRVHAMSASFEKDEKKTQALAIRDRVEKGKTVLDSVRLEIARLLRDCAGWNETLDYINAMPESLRLRPEIQEQRLLAMSETEEPEAAIGHLRELVTQFGSTSERSGLIGGRYKRLYRAAKKKKDDRKAAHYLNLAIKSYYEGMMLDLNDYYPTGNLPQLLRERAKDGDLELAKFAAGVTLRACERARLLNNEDEWLRPTLLGAAFDAEDAVEAERLVGVIETESLAEWKLDNTLDDLRHRVEQVENSQTQARLNQVVERLTELLPPSDAGDN